jgi:hypothetical protein
VALAETQGPALIRRAVEKDESLAWLWRKRS